MGSRQAVADPQGRNVALNAICPYFTMFPLDFPLGVLARADPEDAVLDPFCGRGTTGFAARIRGLTSVGVDSHPLAAALAQAKHVSTTPAAILKALNGILEESESDVDVPVGEFWELAFEGATLRNLARLRAALLRDSRSAARVALRAILLGALHGPATKGPPSYISNQAPRTYAPKPGYAVRYWKDNGLRPRKVNIGDLVARRAVRYYSAALQPTSATVVLGDSRDPALLERGVGDARVRWIVTSPPYYGLRTYRPDQWLRLWFLGGPESVDYSQTGQVTHRSAEDFSNELRQVWRNCARVAEPGTRMVIRFGGISDRTADPPTILRESIADTDWRLQTRCDAGSASTGRRQADHFGVRSSAGTEHDYWAVLA